MQPTPAPFPRRRQLERGVPPVLRPVIRAYVLGYASSTVPRLLTLFLTHLSRRRKNIDEKPEDDFPGFFIRILKGGLEVQRFPTFCGLLIGGSTLLEACEIASLSFQGSLIPGYLDTHTEACCSHSWEPVANNAIEVRQLGENFS